MDYKTSIINKEDYLSLTDEILITAKEAALKAGEIQLENLYKQKEISHKLNEFDLVTNVDKQCEEIIFSIIQKKFPDHELLGEESGISGNQKSDFIWVIDPLDGTTNYAHGFPHFAVSIGLLHKEEICLGTVYDPCKNELFYAQKNQGAFLNDKPIKVSNINELNKSLLATGFPYDRTGIVEENLEYFRKFIYKSQAIRRPGAAALDLCYVACARLDGFWELNLSPWDTAAGACIIREAGGKVTNFNSETFDIFTKNVIATNSLLHDNIQNIINGN